MLTVQRYTKTMSEAQVLRKEMENNKKFHDSLLDDNDWMMRSTNPPTSPDELVSRFRSHIPVAGGIYKSDVMSVVASVVAGLYKKMSLKSFSSEKTVREFVSLFDCHSALRNADISKIANNRGSVAGAGKVGLSVYKETIEKVGSKTIHKTFNQNSKGYQTVLKNYYDFQNKTNLDKDVSIEELKEESVGTNPKETLIPSMLNDLSKMSTNAMPVVIYNMLERRLCVAKMVHKDQIGPREIAVLNSVLRMNAFVLEEVARNIRNVNHSIGDYTNLIEYKEKDEVIASEFDTMRKLKLSGEKVINDNADCSQWGPSMMTYVLCMTIGARLTGVQRRLVIELFKQFSFKVFKLPDNLKKTMDKDQNLGGTNEFSKAVLELRDLDERKGILPSASMKNQILFSFQGMFQGVLGNCSSEFAADALCLSAEVHKRRLKINVTSYDTSDDYVRILRFQSSDEDSVYKLVASSAYYHDYICRSLGIKRNMYKSNFTEHMLEFNSVFRTNRGTFNPDVKSRLSFIDISTDYDWAMSSLRCYSTAVDYLRNEGSVVGSSWVQIVNTHLDLIVTGRLTKFRQSPEMMFRLPLELGGIVRISPVSNSISPQFLVLRQNYNLFGFLDLSDTLKLMINSNSKNPEEDIELVDDNSLKINSISRSGCVCLPSRYPRAFRSIDEFLSGVEEDLYVPLSKFGFKKSMLCVLMTCSQRESKVADHPSAATRFCVPQTPDEAKLYKINSVMMNYLANKAGIEGTNPRVSRNQILNDISNEYMSSFDQSHLAFTNGLDYTVDIDLEKAVSFENGMNESFDSLCPLADDFKITFINKHIHKRPYREDFTLSYDTITKSVEKEKLKHLPVCFGGHCNIKPHRFLSYEVVLQNRLRKLTLIDGTFRLCLMTKDQSLQFSVNIIKSNFIEGGRLEANSYRVLGSPDTATSRMVATLYNEKDLLHGIFDDRRLKSRQVVDYKNKDRATRVDLSWVFSDVISARNFDDRTQFVDAVIKLKAHQDKRKLQGLNLNPIYSVRVRDIKLPDSLKYRGKDYTGIEYKLGKQNGKSMFSLVSIQTHPIKGKERWIQYLTHFSQGISKENADVIKFSSDDVSEFKAYEREEISVSIEEFNGHYFLCAKTNMDQKPHPILHLCYSAPTMIQKIRLHDGRVGAGHYDFIATHEELNRIGYYNVKDLKQMEMELTRMEEEEIKESSEKIPDELDLGYEDMDYIDDFNIEDIDDFLDRNKIYDDDDPFLDGDSDNSIVRSNGSSSKAKVPALKMLSGACQMRRNKEARYWEITIPMKLSQVDYYTDDEGTAVGKLLEAAEKGDYTEYQCLKYVLRVSMLQYKTFTTIVNDFVVF